jgi:hypothetical protein
MLHCLLRLLLLHACPSVGLSELSSTKYSQRLTGSAADPRRDSSGLYHSDQISAVALLRAKRHWFFKHSCQTVCNTA